jgi:hypothetical protein
VFCCGNGLAFATEDVLMACQKALHTLHQEYATATMVVVPGALAVPVLQDYPRRCLYECPAGSGSKIWRLSRVGPFATLSLASLFTLYHF